MIFRKENSKNLTSKVLKEEKKLEEQLKEIEEFKEFLQELDFENSLKEKKDTMKNIYLGF